MGKRAYFLGLVLLLGGMLGGCAGQLAGESYVSAALPASWAVNAMAADAVKKLSSLYPPGHTAIDLVRPMVKDGQGNARAQTPPDAFSLALENGLRKRGFSIAPNAGLRLAWTLDSLIADGENAPQKKPGPEAINWWLRLKLANAGNFETRTLTRMYDGNGAALAGFAESK
jgi:hypothetical protein